MKAGWYPNPQGGSRYWDGDEWGTPPAPQAAGVVVQGPNHILHLLLTVLTFWACGGWLWVWIVVALSNNRRVVTVDAYGRVIQPLRPPRQPNEFTKRVDGWFRSLDGTSIDTWLMWASVAFCIAALVVGAAVVLAHL